MGRFRTIGRVIKWTVVLAIVAGLLGTASYAGARFKVGQILGPDPPNMGQRTITLGYDVVPGTSKKQLVWTFSWSRTPWPGRGPIRIWVSATGDLLRMTPGNLDVLIEQYYKAKEEV